MNTEKTAAPTAIKKDEPSNSITDVDTPSNENKLSDIVSTIEKTKPEISDHAINAYQEKEATIKEAAAGLVDKNGDSFDPAIHKTDSDGNPILTQRGKLSMKAGVKKGGNVSRGTTGKNQSFVGGPKPPSQEELDKIKCRATGAAAANTIITLGVVVGGDEWQPIKNEEYGIDEKANLENAFADYFEATGQTDLPPNLALTVACAAYALPRFTMPKTKARTSKVMTWFKKKWADRKLKKHGLKAVKDTEKTEK